MFRSLNTFAICALLTLASVAQADESEPRERIIELTLTPAAAPVPALKYPLLPPLPELQPQDAVLIYARMFSMGFGPSPTNDADRELLDKYLNSPLDDFSVDEARKLLERNVVRDNWLAHAAMCRDCSWQLPLGERPFFAILLPELHPLRQQAWFLALKTKIQIAEGDADGAIESIRVGYAVARQVAAGPTLIHVLVGVSIAGAFSERVAELGTLPDAPNLYWSLTQLPSPFLNTRDALATETYCMELSYPEWSNPRVSGREEAYWDALLSQLHHDMLLMGDKLPEDFDLAVIREKSYPNAKQHLLDHGMSQEEVERICPAQAIVILTVDTYNRHRDEVFKWAYLPFEAGQTGLLEAIEKVGKTPRNDQGLPLAQLILPSLAHFRVAMQRQERQFALVRTIEALRMHAAEHDGNLPASLADVTCVPVPTDPWLGKPFEYSLAGDTAKLRAAAPEGQPVELTVEYRLKMRKK
ncbi:MAG: hypothetical protein SGJ19_19300 [Planctomycetia bacterium]|nr:hypothetical protein [Planctomycetia bacterium]